MKLITLLKKNKCPCKKKGGESIKIKDCTGFQCAQWKSCSKKTNNMFEKEIKR